MARKVTFRDAAYNLADAMSNLAKANPLYSKSEYDSLTFDWKDVYTSALASDPKNEKVNLDFYSGLADAESKAKYLAIVNDMSDRPDITRDQQLELLKQESESKRNKLLYDSLSGWDKFGATLVDLAFVAPIQGVVEGVEGLVDAVAWLSSWIGRAAGADTTELDKWIADQWISDEDLYANNTSFLFKSAANTIYGENNGGWIIAKNVINETADELVEAGLGILSGGLSVAWEVGGALGQTMAQATASRIEGNGFKTIGSGAGDRGLTSEMFYMLSNTAYTAGMYRLIGNQFSKKLGLSNEWVNKIAVGKHGALGVAALRTANSAAKGVFREVFRETMRTVAMENHKFELNGFQVLQAAIIGGFLGAAGSAVSGIRALKTDVYITNDQGQDVKTRRSQVLAKVSRQQQLSKKETLTAEESQELKDLNSIKVKVQRHELSEQERADIAKNIKAKRGTKRYARQYQAAVNKASAEKNDYVYRPLAELAGANYFNLETTSVTASYKAKLSDRLFDKDGNLIENYDANDLVAFQYIRALGDIFANADADTIRKSIEIYNESILRMSKQDDYLTYSVEHLDILTRAGDITKFNGFKLTSGFSVKSRPASEAEISEFGSGVITNVITNYEATGDFDGITKDRTVRLATFGVNHPVLVAKNGDVYINAGYAKSAADFDTKNTTTRGSQAFNKILATGIACYDATKLLDKQVAAYIVRIFKRFFDIDVGDEFVLQYMTNVMLAESPELLSETMQRDPNFRINICNYIKDWAIKNTNINAGTTNTKVEGTGKTSDGEKQAVARVMNIYDKAILEIIQSDEQREQVIAATQKEKGKTVENTKVDTEGVPTVFKPATIEELKTKDFTDYQHAMRVVSLGKPVSDMRIKFNNAVKYFAEKFGFKFKDTSDGNLPENFAAVLDMKNYTDPKSITKAAEEIGDIETRTNIGYDKKARDFADKVNNLLFNKFGFVINKSTHDIIYKENLETLINRQAIDSYIQNHGNEPIPLKVFLSDAGKDILPADIIDKFMVVPYNMKTVSKEAGSTVYGAAFRNLIILNEDTLDNNNLLHEISHILTNYSGLDKYFTLSRVATKLTEIIINRCKSPDAINDTKLQQDLLKTAKVYNPKTTLDDIKKVITDVIASDDAASKYVHSLLNGEYFNLDYHEDSANGKVLAFTNKYYIKLDGKTIKTNIPGAMSWLNGNTKITPKQYGTVAQNLYSFFTDNGYKEARGEFILAFLAPSKTVNDTVLGILNRQFKGIPDNLTDNQIAQVVEEVRQSLAKLPDERSCLLNNEDARSLIKIIWSQRNSEIADTLGDNIIDTFINIAKDQGISIDNLNEDTFAMLYNSMSPAMQELFNKQFTFNGQPSWNEFKIALYMKTGKTIDEGKVVTDFPVLKDIQDDFEAVLNKVDTDIAFESVLKKSTNGILMDKPFSTDERYIIFDNNAYILSEDNQLLIDASGIKPDTKYDFFGNPINESIEPITGLPKNIYTSFSKKGVCAVSENGITISKNASDSAIALAIKAANDLGITDITIFETGELIAVAEMQLNEPAQFLKANKDKDGTDIRNYTRTEYDKTYVALPNTQVANPMSLIGKNYNIKNSIGRMVLDTIAYKYGLTSVDELTNVGFTKAFVEHIRHDEPFNYTTVLDIVNGQTNFISNTQIVDDIIKAVWPNNICIKSVSDLKNFVNNLPQLLPFLNAKDESGRPIVYTQYNSAYHVARQEYANIKNMGMPVVSPIDNWDGKEIDPKDYANQIKAYKMRMRDALGTSDEGHSDVPNSARIYSTLLNGDYSFSHASFNKIVSLAKYRSGFTSNLRGLSSDETVVNTDKNNGTVSKIDKQISKDVDTGKVQTFVDTIVRKNSYGLSAEFLDGLTDCRTPAELKAYMEACVNGIYSKLESGKYRFLHELQTPEQYSKSLKAGDIGRDRFPISYNKYLKNYIAEQTKLEILHDDLDNISALYSDMLPIFNNMTDREFNMLLPSKEKIMAKTLGIDDSTSEYDKVLKLRQHFDLPDTPEELIADINKMSYNEAIKLKTKIHNINKENRQALYSKKEWDAINYAVSRAGGKSVSNPKSKISHMRSKINMAFKASPYIQPKYADIANKTFDDVYARINEMPNGPAKFYNYDIFNSALLALKNNLPKLKNPADIEKLLNEDYLTKMLDKRLVTDDTDERIPEKYYQQVEESNDTAINLDGVQYKLADNPGITTSEDKLNTAATTLVKTSYDLAREQKKQQQFNELTAYVKSVDFDDVEHIMQKWFPPDFSKDMLNKLRGMFIQNLKDAGKENVALIHYLRGVTSAGIVKGYNDITKDGIKYSVANQAKQSMAAHITPEVRKTSFEVLKDAIDIMYETNRLYQTSPIARLKPNYFPGAVTEYLNAVHNKSFEEFIDIPMPIARISNRPPMASNLYSIAGPVSIKAGEGINIAKYGGFIATALKNLVSGRNLALTLDAGYIKPKDFLVALPTDELEALVSRDILEANTKRYLVDTVSKNGEINVRIQPWKSVPYNERRAMFEASLANDAWAEYTEKPDGTLDESVQFSRAKTEDDIFFEEAFSGKYDNPDDIVIPEQNIVIPEAIKQEKLKIEQPKIEQAKPEKGQYVKPAPIQNIKYTIASNKLSDDTKQALSFDSGETFTSHAGGMDVERTRIDGGLFKQRNAKMLDKILQNEQEQRDFIDWYNHMAYDAESTVRANAFIILKEIALFSANAAIAKQAQEIIAKETSASGRTLGLSRGISSTPVEQVAQFAMEINMSHEERVALQGLATRERNALARNDFKDALAAGEDALKLFAKYDKGENIKFWEKGISKEERIKRAKTALKRMDSFRYLAMLSNPKTFLIKNELSNIISTGTDKAATAIGDAVSSSLNKRGIFKGTQYKKTKATDTSKRIVADNLINNGLLGGLITRKIKRSGTKFTVSAGRVSTKNLAGDFEVNKDIDEAGINQNKDYDPTELDLTFSQESKLFAPNRTTYGNSAVGKAFNWLQDKIYGAMDKMDRKHVAKYTTKLMQQLVAGSFTTEELKILEDVNNAIKHNNERYNQADDAARMARDATFTRTDENGNTRVIHTQLSPENMYDVSLYQAGVTKEQYEALQTRFNDLVEYSMNEALKVYFKSEPAVYKTFTQICMKHPNLRFASTLIFPFPRFTINAAIMALEYSPVGLAKGVWNWIKAERKATEISKQRTALLASENYKNATTAEQAKMLKDFDLANAADPFASLNLGKTIGKGVTGTAILAIGAILGALGVLKLDEEKKYLGPQLYLGDIHIDISDLSPSLTALLLGGTLTMNGGGGFRPMLNQFLDTLIIGDITGTFRDDNVSTIVAPLQNYITQFIPAIVKSLARIIDPRDKNTSSKFIRKFAASIPGLSYAVPSKIDPYTGQAQYMYSSNKGMGIFLSLLNNLILPTPVYDTKPSEVEKEAERIGAGTSNPSSKFTFNDKEYELKGKELERYQRERARIIYENSQKLIATKEYKDADDKHKKAMLKKIYNEATEAAREMIVLNS